MQTATILLSLGGDSGNTIQKYDVTPAEVAVLREIHGNEAVQEIAITGDIDRTNRVERERLSFAYGNARVPDSNTRIVEMLFPGVAARVFQKFSELELPDEFYKATSRAAPVDEPEDDDEQDEAEEQPVKATRGKRAPKVAPAPDDDGVGDMDDAPKGGALG